MATKSVLIIGCALLGKKDAAAVTRGNAVWGINDSFMLCPTVKFDRIYAMDDWQRDKGIDPAYIKRIADRGVPVYTSVAYKEWPCLKEYPLKRVLAMLELDTTLGARILENTVCYAIAHAIALSFECIVLLGMSFDKPYSDIGLRRAGARMQKKYPGAPDWFKYYDRTICSKRFSVEPGSTGVTFLIGMAHARGIDVKIPLGEHLLNFDRDLFFYGFQNQPSL